MDKAWSHVMEHMRMDGGIAVRHYMRRERTRTLAQPDLDCSFSRKSRACPKL